MKVSFNHVLKIACFIALILLILALNFTRIRVTSGSMEPTICEDEMLLVRHTKHLERGDVAMFYSRDCMSYVVKRVIGKGGDIVDIRNGSVYLNGTYLAEDYVSSFYDYTGTFCVPDGSYFMLGDNRADSYDSRKWSNAYVPKGDIVGICYKAGRLKLEKVSSKRKEDR